MTIRIMIDGLLYKSIGEAMRSMRRDAGLTQEQIAERAQLSRNAIALCETDSHLPKLETLEALAQATDNDLTVIFESGTSDKALAALARRIEEQERLYKNALDNLDTLQVETERLRSLLNIRSAKRLDLAVEAVRKVADHERAIAAVTHTQRGGDHNDR